MRDKPKRGRAVKALGVSAVIFALAGCSSLPELPREELLWQGIHAIDVAQTYNGAASDPCKKEVAPITRRLIGEKPKKRDVLLWGVAISMMHAAISDYLRDRHDRAYVAWQAITITNSSAYVAKNFHNGVRPWGDNRCNIP